MDPDAVLIVGAGPSGLFCACELARRGVPTRLIEHAPAPHRQAMATALQPAAQELLHRSGVLEDFAAVARPIRQGLLLLPDGRGRSWRVDEVDSPFPGQLSLPQWQSEALLAQHLNRLGGRLERGVELCAVDDEGAGLRLQLQHREGVSETVRVRCLIDASGAHSRTRASMGEALEGLTYAGHYLAVDALLNDPPPAMRKAEDLSLLSISACGLVLMAPLPEGRTLLFLGGLEAAEAEGSPEPERIAGLLQQRCGQDHGLADVRWASGFRMHRRLAPRLGDGRRFLLGDAGHLSSPLAGEGMNAGLMDAADLAWKLALVLKGAAPWSLMESYAIERGLVDRQVLACADRQHRMVEQLVAAVAAGGPLELPPPDPAADLTLQQARAMLDHSLIGSPLVMDYLSGSLQAMSLPGPQPGERWPDRCQVPDDGPLLLIWGEPPATLQAMLSRWGPRLRGATFQALGLDPTRAGIPAGPWPGAVLVRPDGMVGFRTIPFDAAGVEALESYLMRWLIPAT